MKRILISLLLMVSISLTANAQGAFELKEESSLQGLYALKIKNLFWEAEAASDCIIAETAWWRREKKTNLSRNAGNYFLLKVDERVEVIVVNFKDNSWEKKRIEIDNKFKFAKSSKIFTP